MNESRAEIEWHAVLRPQEQVQTPRTISLALKSNVRRFSRGQERIDRSEKIIGFAVFDSPIDSSILYEKND